ncbi:hypothetical protein HN873_063542, partial [Arachis hypogaea]
IAVGCSRLECLNLKWCFEISDLGVDLLCKKCFYLKVLDVSYLKLSQFHITAPCADCSNIIKEKFGCCDREVWLLLWLWIREAFEAGKSYCGRTKTAKSSNSSV